MPDKGIKVKFEAESSSVKSALSQIDRSSKTIEKQLKEVNKLLEFDPTNINLLTQKQDLLQKAVANTTAQLKGMEDAQKDITAGYQKWQQNQQAIEQNAKAISKMTSQLEDAKTAMKAMEDAGGDGAKLTEEYAAVAGKVKELTKNISSLRKEQKALANDPEAINEDTYQRYLTTTERLRINLQQLNIQQSQVSSAIADGGRSAAEAARAEEEAARAAEEQARAEADRKRAAEQAAEADKQAKKAADDYKSALNQLKTAANNVKNDIKGMATVVATTTAAIGSAVVAGTTATAKVGMEYTKSMSKVQALSGATVDEMLALGDAASAAGANTSKTAAEAADALGFMSLAGWDTSQMLEGLMPILRASEAGEMDLAKCSDAVTDSMSAMGIAVDDLQHYLDVCAKTQSSANTSMEELLDAYIACGGTLKNLNIPLEESATILGTLANRGIKGAEAGNALNSILVNLIGANKNAASAMKDMGISAFDANGRFIGLEETLKLVKAKLDEYGDDTEKITQLEAKLGGKTQLDTLQALLSGVSEEYDELNGKILDCNGALESTARTMQDNLSGDITSLQSALEGVENTIFSSLEEPFRSAAQNVTQDLRTLNAACSDGELADSIRKIANSVSELISKASKFATDEAFPTLIKWLEWIADHSDAVIAAIKGLGAAWASWKIMQYASHIKELVDAIKLVQAASTAATATQNGLAASAATAAASEEALAAAGQMVATAQMLAVAAIVAVTAALASYLAKKIDAAAEELKHKNQIDETTQAIYDQNAAYKEGLRAAEENAKAADKNAEAAKHYWTEVQNLVDENGRAVGSTEELKTAVARLNEVAGTNIEIVNGQIQGYQELSNTMDNFIETTRRQAKASYLQDSYGEALLNIESTTEQYNQAWDELNAATAEYNEKRRLFNAAQDSRFYTKDQLKELEAAVDAANERVAQASAKYSALADSYQNYTNVIEEYEGLYTDNTVSEEAAKSTQQMQAEETARRIEEEARRTAELAKLGVKQTWEELEADLNDLDEKLAIHAIDEGTYWEERRKKLEDSQYKESRTWWSYYDAVTDHYDKLSETEKKAQEEALKKQQSALKDSIDDQIAVVKERQELENEYTKEMMYNDMEEIISGLDKESDLYKKYNSEILKGRKALADEGTKTIAAGLKADVTEVENSIKTVVSDYQNSLKNLLSQRDSYFSKLFDTSSFATRSRQTDKNGNEADVLTLSDPQEAYKKLLEYEKAYEKLKAKNVSENVMSWLDSLDMATAQDTMDILNHMSDSQLKSYSSNFDKYKEKAMQMADNKYAAQIDELNTGFIQKVDDLLATLPGRAEVDGENTVAGFIQGLANKGGDLSDAASDFANRFIEQIKADLDINSPSGEAEDLGEYTGEGFVKGLVDSADMADAVDNFTDSFIAKLAQKDPEIRAAMEDTFTGNLTAVLANMETLADASLNRIAASLSGKLPALPDVTQLALPSVEAVSSASGIGSSDMATLIDRIDVIIALVQGITISTADGQTIKLQLEIGGILEADMDRLAAILSKKFDNISIQTGRKVFSY